MAEEITVAIANPTLEVLLVAIKWKEGNDIPIAVEVPANETIRIQVERIEKMDLSIFGPTTIESSVEWLVLQIGTHLFSLPIVPAMVVAHPPSVQLQPLYPYWNLQSIQNQTPTVIQPNQKTVVQLRKLFGKWEFFVSCSGNVLSSQLTQADKLLFFTTLYYRTVFKSYQTLLQQRVGRQVCPYQKSGLLMTYYSFRLHVLTVPRVFVNTVLFQAYLGAVHTQDQLLLIFQNGMTSSVFHPHNKNQLLKANLSKDANCTSILVINLLEYPSVVTVVTSSCPSNTIPPKNVRSNVGDALYVARSVSGYEVASPAPSGAKPEPFIRNLLKL